MSTRGVLVFWIDGRFYHFWSYSDSYPNYLGRIISQFMRWFKLRNVELTRPDILNEFIREWRAKGYTVSPPLAEDYYTVEHCNTIDDVMRKYQQEYCDYIYVLENTEAGEFKVTFSNAWIKCLDEYTQNYVSLTQIEFERLVKHWFQLCKDDKWSNASVEKKRSLVAKLDPAVCARNIQKIWRGHDVRWKCPCFSFNENDGMVRPRPLSFNDTDGTVPLRPHKMQKTE